MPRKKSANGDGTIRTRQLANGTTVYDLLWSYRDRDGRLKRGAKKGFRTEREANRFRRQTPTAVDTHTYVAPAKVLVGEYLENWLAGLRLKPQTIAGYQGDARLHITPHIGHIPLADLTPAHLNGLYTVLERQGSP